MNIRYLVHWIAKLSQNPPWCLLCSATCAAKNFFLSQIGRYLFFVPKYEHLSFEALLENDFNFIIHRSLPPSYFTGVQNNPVSVFVHFNDKILLISTYCGCTWMLSFSHFWPFLLFLVEWKRKWWNNYGFDGFNPLNSKECQGRASFLFHFTFCSLNCLNHIYGHAR